MKLQWLTMNEQAWLDCNDSRKLLNSLGIANTRVGYGGKWISWRKLRLIMCAWCRVNWLRLPQVAKDAITTSEAFADGKIDEDTRRSADLDMLNYWGAYGTGNETYIYVCTWIAHNNNHLQEGVEPLFQLHQSPIQCDLLRDIVNPHHSPKVSKQCQADRDVKTLATLAYDQGEWDVLPQLGDALQDAGCDDEVLLAHLNQPTKRLCWSGTQGWEYSHIKGCWAVDAILDSF